MLDRDRDAGPSKAKGDNANAAPPRRSLRERQIKREWDEDVSRVHDEDGGKKSKKASAEAATHTPTRDERRGEPASVTTAALNRSKGTTGGELRRGNSSSPGRGETTTPEVCPLSDSPSVEEAEPHLTLEERYLLEWVDAYPLGDGLGKQRAARFSILHQSRTCFAKALEERQCRLRERGEMFRALRLQLIRNIILHGNPVHHMPAVYHQALESSLSPEERRILNEAPISSHYGAMGATLSALEDFETTSDGFEIPPVDGPPGVPDQGRSPHPARLEASRPASHSLTFRPRKAVSTRSQTHQEPVQQELGHGVNQREATGLSPKAHTGNAHCGKFIDTTSMDRNYMAAKAETRASKQPPTHSEPRHLAGRQTPKRPRPLLAPGDPMGPPSPRSLTLEVGYRFGRHRNLVKGGMLGATAARQPADAAATSTSTYPSIARDSRGRTLHPDLIDGQARQQTRSQPRLEAGARVRARADEDSDSPSHSRSPRPSTGSRPRSRAKLDGGPGPGPPYWW